MNFIVKRNIKNLKIFQKTILFHILIKFLFHNYYFITKFSSGIIQESIATLELKMHAQLFLYLFVLYS